VANNPGNVVGMIAGAGEPLLGREAGNSLLQRAGVEGEFTGGAGDDGWNGHEGTSEGTLTFMMR
jgi:hypothetical protein